MRLGLGLIGLVLVLALVACQVMTTYADQSARTAYNDAQEIDHAVMNSVVDNPDWGDERDFIRLKTVETGQVAVGEAEIEPGQEYEVQIYYRNDASEKYNSKEHDRVGVAREVRLSTKYPGQLNADGRGEITAKITAENTNPLWVQSVFKLTAREDLTLHYVAASAKIQNNYKANGSVLSRAVFSGEGTMLGMDELNGMIFGGMKYGGKVVYRLKAIAAGDVALVKDDPNGGVVMPVLPSELPKTGPVEIVFGVLIALLIVVGLVYAFYSRRMMRKTARARRKKQGGRKKR